MQLEEERSGPAQETASPTPSDVRITDRRTVRWATAWLAAEHTEPTCAPCSAGWALADEAVAS
jgi:hypothetical protein